LLDRGESFRDWTRLANLLRFNLGSFSRLVADERHAGAQPLVKRSNTRLLVLLLATSLPCMWLGWRLTVRDSFPHDNGAVSVKIPLEDVKEWVDLVPNEDGTFSYVLFRTNGPPEKVTADELARRLYEQQHTRNWLNSVFNVSNPLGLIWIGVGLLGQVLFTGRMVVQWLASEKSRRSVVPPIFWWMSLLGSMMLLSYFIWRRDIVGVLGQGFGLVVYIRNIYLIWLTNHATAALAAALADGADPNPESGVIEPASNCGNATT
jgi:lipid-A-disaccharide synthase-like uncharacterized protein